MMDKTARAWRHYTAREQGFEPRFENLESAVLPIETTLPKNGRRKQKIRNFLHTSFAAASFFREKRQALIRFIIRAIAVGATAVGAKAAVSTGAFWGGGVSTPRGARASPPFAIFGRRRVVAATLTGLAVGDAVGAFSFIRIKPILVVIAGAPPFSPPFVVCVRLVLSATFLGAKPNALFAVVARRRLSAQTMGAVVLVGTPNPPPVPAD